LKRSATNSSEIDALFEDPAVSRIAETPHNLLASKNLLILGYDSPDLATFRRLTPYCGGVPILRLVQHGRTLNLAVVKQRLCLQSALAWLGAYRASCYLREESVVAKFIYRSIAVVILMQTAGCGNAINWWGPQGTMRQQQLDASVYDPYAEPDVGPEVVGSRPRDFQKPFAEPVRNSRPGNSLWGR
jgi:hypothetical protein